MINFVKHICRAATSRLRARITIESGDIPLNFSELNVLRCLTLDQASISESMAFYTTIVSKGYSFPLEWEQYVLRTQLKKFPERNDLRQRLAVVLEHNQSKNSTEASVTFNRLWHRFQGLDFRSARAEAFSAAVSLLSSPEFSKHPVAFQVDIVTAIHNTCMSAPGEELIVLSELGLQHFPNMLKDPDLNESQACRVYDSLHGLYFAGISDVRDLRRFDRITPKLEAWLQTQHKSPNLFQDNISLDKDITVAYLLHTAHFLRGNAVSPLIAALAETHAQRANRRILLYAIQHVAEDFASNFTNSNVKVLTFPQDQRYDQIDEIAQSMREEKVDIVCTEQNRALAAALFVRRVAPIQMWIDTGFPFWDLSTLDWSLSPVSDQNKPYPERTSPFTWRQPLQVLKSSGDTTETKQIRNYFPEDVFILGVFARLPKVSSSYLDFLERLVASHPRFHLLIAGPGDPTHVESFLDQSKLKGKIIFQHGYVDLDIYAPAVDLMCDTFPFIGGLACRIFSAHGIPVLSMLGTPWDKILIEDRNPELLACTEEEYIELAQRMANDMSFYQAQQKIAQKKIEESCESSLMIDEIEAGFCAANEARQKLFASSSRKHCD